MSMREKMNIKRSGPRLAGGKWLVLIPASECDQSLREGGSPSQAFLDSSGRESTGDTGTAPFQPCSTTKHGAGPEPLSNSSRAHLSPPKATQIKSPSK